MIEWRKKNQENKSCVFWDASVTTYCGSTGGRAGRPLKLIGVLLSKVASSFGGAAVIFGVTSSLPALNPDALKMRASGEEELDSERTGTLEQVGHGHHPAL